ncbi:MAG TPA: hypothetical protein VGN20_18220 [Mucilaginibacter sp.]|jgi:hypothetical protein
MIRTILKSDKKILVLQLPDDLVGKTIEVIAFSIEDTNTTVKDSISTENSVTAFKNKIKSFSFNSGGYKFDRDEANDYE